MNTDLKEMFDEKNQSLFLNKLLMDLDNNTETFKLSSNNTVKMEIAKLLSNLKKIYDKYQIEINDEKIKEVLKLSKNELLNGINNVIDNKKNKNSSYIKSPNESSLLNSKYVKAYHKFVDNNEKEFKDSLTIMIYKISETNIYNSLIRFFPCINEEMQQDIFMKINVDFAKNLINRISSESTLRNRTLKNMCEENYKTYLNMSKTSNKVGKKTKKKTFETK